MPEIVLGGKPKRHRLMNMRYDEISLVDKGANQHAHVLIVKRAPEDLQKGLAPVSPGYKQPGQKMSNTGGQPKSKPQRKADWYASNRAPANANGSQRAKNWDNAKHPRQGAGNPAGGQFATTSAASKKKYGKGGTTKAKLQTKKKTSTTKKTTTKTQSYKTVKGDTLWALAQKYYGSGSQWKKIAQANGIKDPKKLPIGMTLKIPGITTAVKKPAAKKVAVKSPGKKLVMNPGGKVHWQTISAKPKNTTPKKVAKPKTVPKKVVKKRLTGSEEIRLAVMFDSYTGRR